MRDGGGLRRCPQLARTACIVCIAHNTDWPRCQACPCGVCHVISSAGTCVQLVLAPGASAKKAATSVSKALAHGALRSCGVTCADAATYEAEVRAAAALPGRHGLGQRCAPRTGGQALTGCHSGTGGGNKQGDVYRGVGAHVPLAGAAPCDGEPVPVIQQRAHAPSAHSVEAYEAPSSQNKLRQQQPSGRAMNWCRHAADVQLCSEGNTNPSTRGRIVGARAARSG